MSIRLRAAYHDSSKPTGVTDTGLSTVPIAVDLDGSLSLDDTTRVMTVRLLLRRPWRIGGAARRLTRGRDQFKLYLWEVAPCRVDRLRFRSNLVDWLTQQANAGRRIHLVTGAPLALAERVAEVQPFSCAAHGTTAGHNLTGHRKAEFLCARFGVRGFDYVGNARVDLAVWATARRAIVCGRSPRLLQDVSRICDEVGPVFT